MKGLLGSTEKFGASKNNSGGSVGNFGGSKNNSGGPKKCLFVVLDVVDLLVDAGAEGQGVLDVVVAVFLLACRHQHAAIAEEAAHEGLLNADAFALAQQQLMRCALDDAALEDETAGGEHILLAAMNGHGPDEGGQPHGQHEDETQQEAPAADEENADSQHGNEARPEIDDAMKLGLEHHFLALHEVFLYVSHIQ